MRKTVVWLHHGEGRVRGGSLKKLISEQDQEGQAGESGAWGWGQGEVRGEYSRWDAQYSKRDVTVTAIM